MIARIEAAAPGGWYLVMTHSHDLDYALVRAILKRGDAAWIGLIGSATKRARFASRLAKEGLSADPVRCPIGIGTIRSKAPHAIAISVAAELLQGLEAGARARSPIAPPWPGASTTPRAHGRRGGRASSGRAPAGRGRRDRRRRRLCRPLGRLGGVEVEALPGLVVPGFVDCHVHYPRLDSVAAYGAAAASTGWSSTSSRPRRPSPTRSCPRRGQGLPRRDAEERHDQRPGVRRQCRASADALFEEAHGRNMRIVAGKALMDRFGPPELLDTPDQAQADTEALIKAWGGKGAARLRRSPRASPCPARPKS